jgi:hypothetical protein
LQERVEASLGLWGSAGGQAQVRENFDDDGGILNDSMLRIKANVHY